VLQHRPPLATPEETNTFQAAFEAAPYKYTETVHVGASTSPLVTHEQYFVAAPPHRQWSFFQVPTIGNVRTIDACCGDTFEVHAVDVTISGFRLVVNRTDSQSGWAQLLVVEWSGFHAGSDAPTIIVEGTKEEL